MARLSPPVMTGRYLSIQPTSYSLPPHPQDLEGPSESSLIPLLQSQAEVHLHQSKSIFSSSEFLWHL